MAIKTFELDSATDLNKDKLPIKTINNQSPDASGNVSVDVGVKTVNGHAPDSAGGVTLYTAGTDDLTPGESALETGKVYLMYE